MKNNLTSVLFVFLMLFNTFAFADKNIDVIHQYFEKSRGYELKEVPNRINSLAIREVFVTDFYDVRVHYKPDGAGFAEVLRLGLSFNNTEVVAFPSMNADVDISKDIVKLIKKDFRMTNEGQANILLEALKDAFSVSILNHDSNPNYSSVERKGNVWKLNVAKFFDEYQTFVVTSDNLGKVQSIAFHLSI